MMGATFFAKRSTFALVLATARPRTSASLGLPRSNVGSEVNKWLRLHTKKAEVLSISQNAATVPIAYAAITSSRLTVR